MHEGCVVFLKDGKDNAVTDVFGVVLSPTKLIETAINIAVVLV